MSEPIDDRDGFGPVLWLLRHGKAADPLGMTDFERPLTGRGRAQSTEAGQTLARLQPHISAVLTSPRVRAFETAELAVAAHGNAPDPEIFAFLGGDYGLGDLLGLISPWTGFPGDIPDGPGALERDDAEPGSVVVVGHNPTLAILAHELTGDERGLSTGTLVGIDIATRTVLHHIAPDA